MSEWGNFERLNIYQDGKCIGFIALKKEPGRHVEYPKQISLAVPHRHGSALSYKAPSEVCGQCGKANCADADCGD